MSSRKNVRVAIIALVAVIFLAGGGWVAARQIKSPAQVAADTAPPKPSQITAAVVKQRLSAEVTTRGTVRYGLPTPISVPNSALKSTLAGPSIPIIGTLPKPGQKLRERSVVMTLSGRPMIVLAGDQPMHRDLSPGSVGPDVRQLEAALLRAGLNPGPVDGRYDGATAAAVAGLYRRVGSTPFGVTDAQFDKVSIASLAVASATDKVLQARLALRVAVRGATAAEVNQARLDAAAVNEAIANTGTALGTARGRIADANDLAVVARRVETTGDPTARRDIATAGIDVTTKQNALNDALQALSESQRTLSQLPPDAPPAEIETARAAVRTTTSKVNGARADLDASQNAYAAAEGVLRGSSDKGRDDGRKARRDLAVAHSDLRQGQRLLATLMHKREVARARIKILIASGPSGVERQAVAAASSEQARTRRELSRLAGVIGVQVPADEILFVPSTPANVDAVAATAKRGTPAVGELITVTNTRLAIDSALSVEDAKLVKVGQPVKISAPDLHVELTGFVRQVATQNGTNGVEAGKRYIEIQPSRAQSNLVNTSVALKIAVKASAGPVLTVPTNAVSTGADGDQRVQVVLRGGRTRFVKVDVGLLAQGFYEVTPRGGGSLKPGDHVVIGASGATTAGKSPSNVPIPPTPLTGATNTTGSTGATNTTGSTGATNTTGSAGGTGTGSTGTGSTGSTGTGSTGSTTGGARNGP